MRVHGNIVRWVGGLVAGVAVAGAAPACDDPRTQALQAALVAESPVQLGSVPAGHDRFVAIPLRVEGRIPIHLMQWEWVGAPPTDVSVSHMPPVVESGASGRVLLRFSPQAVGRREGVLRLVSDAELSPQLEIPVSGLGIRGAATLDLPPFEFGRVEVGAARSLSGTVRAAPDEPAYVQFEAPTGPDAEAFSWEPVGDAVLAAATQSSVVVRFHPLRTGSHSAQALVLPCPSCAWETVSLTGEGIAAALEAYPAEVDAGVVTPGSSTVAPLRLTNVGSAPLTLTRLDIDGGQADWFSASITGTPGGATALPAVLPAGGAVDVEIRFSPRQMDGAHARLVVRSAEGPGTTVPLSGSGGGPDIDTSPPALGFPRGGVGLAVDKRVTVRNVGHDPNGLRPLVISEVRVPPGSTFAVQLPRPLPWTLEAGRAQGGIVVRYAPARENRDENDVLEFVSNDPDEPVLRMPLHGSAIPLGDCSYAVVPAQLSFGSVQPGSTARLAVRIRNVGAEACGIANLRLAPGSSRAFAVDPLSSRIIAPGEQLVVPVTFSPVGDATHAGAVVFDALSTARPQASVPLTGHGRSGCVVIDPDRISLGSTGLSCPPLVTRVTVRNLCPGDETIDRAWIDDAGLSGFGLDPTLSWPRLLGAGDSVVLPVQYLPLASGDDLAPLYVQVASEGDPRLVSLEARAEAQPTRTEEFRQPPQPQVDFLFVIDNSGSLTEEQEAIGRHFDAFIRSAVRHAVDFRIAVTTTGITPYSGGWTLCPGGADGGEAGRFFPVDNTLPRILAPNTPRLREVFRDIVRVGTCHWWEEGLEASRLALSSPLIDLADDPTTPAASDGNGGFLRPEASLHVLWVSDEEDGGHGDPRLYASFLRSLKPGHPERVGASAIVGLPSCATAPSVGRRYLEVVQNLGGLVGDICDSDWGGLLDRIGSRAFAPRLVFVLAQVPLGRGNVTVLVDGTTVSPSDASGAMVWRYDPLVGDAGAVVFEPPYAPPPGALIEVTYPVDCPQ